MWMSCNSKLVFIYRWDLDKCESKLVENLYFIMVYGRFIK